MMSHGKWLSKRSLLSDLAEVTGVRCYRGITAVRDKPRAITDTQEDDEYYRTLQQDVHDRSTNVEGPDLELIGEMLQMMKNSEYDDNEDVGRTNDESAESEILTISKLNPNVQEFKPKCLSDYNNSPSKVKKDVNLNHENHNNESQMQKYHDGKPKNPDCIGAPEVEIGCIVNPEVPLGNEVRPDVKDVNLKAVLCNDEGIGTHQNCNGESEQKDPNVNPVVPIDHIEKPKVTNCNMSLSATIFKKLDVHEESDNKLGIQKYSGKPELQDRTAEPEAQKGRIVNPELPKDDVMKPEIKNITLELHKKYDPKNCNVTSDVPIKHNLKLKMPQDCNVKPGVKIKSIDQTIEENIQQFKSSTRSDKKIFRNAAMASLLGLQPPTPKVTLLTPDYFTRTRASTEVKEPLVEKELEEYNVVDFLADSWDSVKKSTTVAIHTDENEVIPPENKRQKTTNLKTPDDSSEHTHSKPVIPDRKIDLEQPVLAENGNVLPPERSADIKPDVTVADKPITTDVDSGHPCDKTINKSDIKPDVAVKDKPTTTDVVSGHPCDKTMNESIDKVGSWLAETKPEKVTPSLCLGPFKYKRKVKKPEPQQNREPVASSPQRKVYVPSQLAEDLYLEFKKRSEMNLSANEDVRTNVERKRSEMNSSANEDVWTKVERELKKKDELIRTKNLEQEHSAILLEIETESEANSI